MRQKLPGTLLSLTAVVTMLAMSGCYEYEDAPAPAATASAPDGGTSVPAAGTPSGRGSARPSLGNARAAAARTVERSDQHQRDIEKALEDQD